MGFFTIGIFWGFFVVVKIQSYEVQQNMVSFGFVWSFLCQNKNPMHQQEEKLGFSHP
jgi:hypothetical protein